MRNWAVRILAVIGLLCVLKWGFDAVQLQTDADAYLSNCEKVHLGMSLEEAKKIMGDYEYYKRANRSEIWTFLNSDTTKVYYLNYPTPFMASEQTAIYFDPVTQIVVGVTCGESRLKQ